jgi:two-component system sensor histidine kinase QseC
MDFYGFITQFKVIQLSTKLSANSEKSPIKPNVIELKELQPMITQLNNLLRRLDQSLQAEQRFTADA